MPNVVTPFTRKRRSTPESGSAPRHRREGHFDEQDRWHDSDESTEPATHRAEG